MFWEMGSSSSNLGMLPSTQSQSQSISMISSGVSHWLPSFLISPSWETILQWKGSREPSWTLRFISSARRRTPSGRVSLNCTSMTPLLMPHQ